MNIRNELQGQEWNALFERISTCLQRSGPENAFRSNEYWILDDDWGRKRHEIEIQNLNILKPPVIKALQALLSEYPEWEIAIGVDVVEQFQGWPEMGLIIRNDEIIDGLRRQYLPTDMQAVAYQGRVRKLSAER